MDCILAGAVLLAASRGAAAQQLAPTPAGVLGQGANLSALV